MTEALASSEVVPLCPHFGPCGGCQLQHLAYPSQLSLKQARLIDLLTAAGISSPPSVQTHSGDPWSYRNRIRLRVEPDPAGGFAVGYNRGATADFLPIRTCPIAAPLLPRAALTLASLASDPSSTDHSTIALWLAATAELELFTTPTESHLQLTLLLRSAPSLNRERLLPSFTQLCEALRRHVPQLAGAGASLLRRAGANSSRPRANRRDAAAFSPPVWGAPGLLYTVPDAGSAHALWVSRASFFQVNRFLVETLVGIATRDLPSASGTLAWDLFAGVGLFTRVLAARFTHVTAVDSAPASTADLGSAHLANVRVLTSAVLDFLRVAALNRDRPSLVLLDPPRAGLGLEAATLLARLRPPRIIYVSCDPVTLARDLAPMLSSGYNLAELHLVDMFPQTSHQETVAVLDLSPSLS